MYEMDYWQSIYIIYKGYNIIITGIDASNKKKKKIMIFITSNVSSYSNSPLVTDNNNSDKHNKSNYNKIHKRRSRKKELKYFKRKRK